MVPRRQESRETEAGFLLIFIIVAVFLILLTLSIAAPRIAMQIKRDREQETRQRAAQYTRAIQLYYRKSKTYPASMEQLKKSNNTRYLRQEYIDPMTGQKDWKLIHVGENKTQVKGFFGEDLPGIAGASGLTSAASGGLSQNSPSSSAAGATGSAFNSSSPASAPNSAFGASASATGATTGSSGVSSQSATTFGGSGGGAFMGVGIPKQGESLLTVNEQTTYQDWEFLYDPRIEALRAKATLTGGISSGSATSASGLSTIGGSPTNSTTTTPTATPAPATAPPP